MERFIEAVRQYPCLWNVSSKEYRNIDKKEDAWKSIVDDLNLPEIKDVKAAKSEWKKLRDNHRDSLKRMKTTRTGQAATNTNTWKYAELLEFLLPYMKNRSRSTNLNSANTQSSETPETPETSEVRDDEDANNSEISVFSSNDAINNTARRVSEAGISQEGRTETRKRNAEGDFIQLLKEMEQNHEKRQEDRDLRRAMTNAQEKKDAIDLFLKSMAITIKTMPTWMQNRIKKKIFVIVSDAEEELQNYSYPGSVNNTLPAAAGSSHTANYEYSTSASAETVNNTIPAAAGSSSSANTIYHEYSRPGTFEPSPLHDYDN